LPALILEGLMDALCCVQYELLDEMMDFGYPQYTEATILSEFIKTDAYRMEVTQRPPMAVTNAVSWRSEGIRYKKNEVRYITPLFLLTLVHVDGYVMGFVIWSVLQVFLDVVESVNILVNSNGQIVRSDIIGALKMRTFLR
jgi:AP-1 complex subunit mu